MNLSAIAGFSAQFRQPASALEASNSIAVELSHLEKKWGFLFPRPTPAPAPFVPLELSRDFGHDVNADLKIL